MPRQQTSPEIKKTWARVNRIMDAARNMAEEMPEHRIARSYIEEMQSHEGYCEPGYDDDACVITGNWNDISGYSPDGVRTVASDLPSRVARLLERAGASIEWSDEWMECDDCHRIFRTQPDCMSWAPSFGWVSECTPVCSTCIGDSPSDYFDHCASDPESNIAELLDPTDHQYHEMPIRFERRWDGPARGRCASACRKMRIKGFIFGADPQGRWTSYDDRDVIRLYIPDELGIAEDDDEALAQVEALAIAEGLGRMAMDVPALDGAQL